MHNTPLYKKIDPARITKMKEDKRSAIMKASELSGQKVSCGPCEEDGYFWLYRVNDCQNYSEFWTKYRELTEEGF